MSSRLAQPRHPPVTFPGAQKQTFQARFQRTLVSFSRVRVASEGQGHVAGGQSLRA